MAIVKHITNNGCTITWAKPTPSNRGKSTSDEPAIAQVPVPPLQPVSKMAVTQDFMNKMCSEFMFENMERPTFKDWMIHAVVEVEVTEYNIDMLVNAWKNHQKEMMV